MRYRLSFPLLLAVSLAIGGCSVGPVYHRPDAPVSATFKETAGWAPAAPADAIARGPWWTLFGDPLLDDLASKVEVSNQNVAAATAAYAQARALMAEQRASLFPSVTLDGSVGRSGGSRSTTGVRNSDSLSLGAGWDADVWGRLRNALTSQQATAQASAADLAAATLSAQGELVIDYVLLRSNDAQAAVLDATIEGYQRSLTITQNRYASGIAPKTDVLQAQTQLTSAQADRAQLAQSRGQYEHAIAVLIGQPPGDFAIARANWITTIPTVPVGVPSELLQRRPDIAGAERRMQSANAEIGVARAAYFPSLTLSGSYGTAGSRVPDLFSASNSLWSIGLSAAQTIFDAGAIRARVEASRAAYDQSVANYRQIVLTAFAAVEDQLSAAKALAEQYALQQQSSAAADEAERLILNQYRSGLVSYSNVVTAQATAANARRSLQQITASRQSAAVSLIQALGGGWSDAQLASR